MNKIRIHLADDQQILIDSLTNLLGTIENFEVVGSSSDSSTIYEDVVQNNANILVMDINMPKKDVFEVLKELNQNGVPCKVIILSSYDDLKSIKEAIKLGVNGYLTKKCAGKNIIEAIKAVHQGQDYFCNAVREKIFNSFTQNNPDLNKKVHTESHTLSRREIEIITLISLEYSGKEIGEYLFISTNTVETHRKNIMRKLQTRNTIGLVKYALKNNLINA